MRYIQRASLSAAVVALALALPGCAQASTEAGASSAEEKKAAPGGGEKVATIGGTTVTADELEAWLKRSNPQAIRDYFDARKQALEGLINSKLMEAEAARQGVTVEQLQSNILATAGAVTDADVEKFYNDNQSRMGMNSLDAMRERIRQYLENQNRQQALGAFFQQQRAQQGVAVHLAPPREEVAVAEHDATKGPAGAPITIVEFSDFQ